MKIFLGQYAREEIGLVWASGHIFGVKYAHALVIFFKARDVIKLAILSIFLCSLNYNKHTIQTDLK